SILEELKKSPTMIDAAINQVIIGMNGQIDKLKEANSNLGTTTQDLQKMRTSLSQSTDGVSQTLSEFKTATKTLGESVKENTPNQKKNKGEVTKVVTKMQAPSATLGAAMQGFQETGKALGQRTTEISQETEKLKTTTQGIQQTGKDLSQRAIEVSQPLNDL